MIFCQFLEYIGNKISSRLGILRRARKVLPKPTCQMPLFEYCSPVWDICGVGSKAYLDKLNRRAACIIEGGSIGAEELKSTLGWPSLQARRNYLKCVLVDRRLHGIAPSYFNSQSLGTRTFSMAITPEAVICCALPSKKLQQHPTENH